MIWRWFAVFDKVERRVIYAILFVACFVPFLFNVRLPLKAWKETKACFDLVDTCPPNKVVIICSNWTGGSQGENWPQYQAVVSHCMMKGVKLVVFSLDGDPTAPAFAEKVNEIEATKYGRVYGKDWVHLGLQRGAPLMMGTIGRNLKSAFPTDYKGYATNDTTKLPILAGINSCKDYQILFCIEYQSGNDWMVWLDPTGSTPVAFASAGIVTGSWYPFLASGQMKGMIAGIRGAAEYENLVKTKYRDRYDDHDLRGNRILVPLAFGHLVIILFIILGNVGMIAKKRMRSREA